MLRVRAEFVRPTAFVRDPNVAPAIVARGQIATASLAITTLRSRTPLVFASVNDKSGKALLFSSAARCDADK